MFPKPNELTCVIEIIVRPLYKVCVYFVSLHERQERLLFDDGNGDEAPAVT